MKMTKKISTFSKSVAQQDLQAVVEKLEEAKREMDSEK